MSALDMVVNLNSKAHYCDEIDRKVREIEDLKMSIKMYYDKILDDGVLEGTREGDMLIDDIDDILLKIDEMNEICIDTKLKIKRY